MSVAFDEYGRPLIILRESQQQGRIRGIEAQKQHILAAYTVASIMETSLGPKGMDKILVGPDGDLTVTNDGATILQKMDVKHQIARLMVELSQSQDDEIGDGTTGVVVLAGAMLRNAEDLLDKGIHPLWIAKGYETAAEVAVSYLATIRDEFHWSMDDPTPLVTVAKTSLGSKIVTKSHQQMAEIAVHAVLEVADLERRDVNLDLIKMQGRIGGSLKDTALVKGIIIEKEMSHSQMPKQVPDAKIALLTCSFEPPKPKTKYNLDLSTVKQYEELQEQEQTYFTKMVSEMKSSGANIVMCQWGFDDEANHLLYQEQLPAVRWVSGGDLELIAVATGARIVPRFQELSENKLGHCAVVREMSLGTDCERMIVLEGCKHAHAVTVFVRGGSEVLIEETKRSLHDAMCATRNLIRDPHIVYGGGSVEIAMSRSVKEAAEKRSDVVMYGMLAFADALEAIPRALASNAGMDGINVVSTCRARQASSGNPRLGVDCMQTAITDMKEAGVIESYISKRQQILLATQMVKLILKIDDVIEPTDF